MKSARQLMWLRRAGTFVLLCALAACGDATETPEPGTTGGVELPGGKLDLGGLGERLEGLDDPIAEWVRTRADLDEEGVMSFPVRMPEVATAVAEIQGCEPSSVINYVVSDDLVGDEVFPRIITAMCVKDTTRFDRVFFALSEALEGDVDAETVEMFAWDATTHRYNFYKLEFNDEDEQQLLVQPPECMDCHLGANGQTQDGIRPVPIMNEIARPWSHWLSEPDFPSHNFTVPDAVKDQPNYAELAGDGWVGSAPHFEAIVRAGIDRAQNGRMRDRREKPATIETAMGLLRPLFCAERLNYAAEDHDSYVIQSSVVVDSGFKSLFGKVSTDWGFNWYSAGSLRLHSDSQGEALDQVPVRGVADEALESLLAGKGLDPMPLLQIRALDWQRPVFSDFRCKLWIDANERFEEDPPELSEDERLYKLLPLIYAQILQIEVPAAEPDAAAQRVSLVYEADPNKLLVVDRWTEETRARLTAAIAGGTLSDADCNEAGFCLMDLEALGGALEAYIQSFELPDGREKLRLVRNERACRAVKCFGAAPAIADIVGCETSVEPEEGERACVIE